MEEHIIHIEYKNGHGHMRLRMERVFPCYKRYVSDFMTLIRNGTSNEEIKMLHAYLEETKEKNRQAIEGYMNELRGQWIPASRQRKLEQKIRHCKRVISLAECNLNEMGDLNELYRY